MMQAETYLASWRCAEPCATPFCTSLAWPWLMLRAHVACLTVPSFAPTNGLDGWRSPDATTLSTVAQCSDVCTCGGEHTEGDSYYVSAVDGPRRALILGPYTSHSFALSMVETGRRLAERRDYRAHWYAFGTAAKRSGEGIGILMADLAEEQHEADVEWDRERAAEEAKPKRCARKAVSR